MGLFGSALPQNAIPMHHSFLLNGRNAKRLYQPGGRSTRIRVGAKPNSSGISSSCASLQLRLAIRSLATLLSVLLLTNITFGQETSATTESISLDALETHREQANRALTKAFATGRLQRRIEKSDTTKPILVQDATFQVFFDWPKFRVDIESEILMTPDNSQASGWRQAGRQLQCILFDGETVFSYERTGTTAPQKNPPNGEERNKGDIFYAFALEAVMRNGGLPLSDPIRLWNDAFDPSEANARNTTFHRLPNNGVLGTEDRGNYQTKFLVLGESPYQLKRVAKYRPGQLFPFREFDLSWTATAGVNYVDRFVMKSSDYREQKRSGNYIIETNRLEIAFSHVDIGVSFEEGTFSVSSLPLKSGTVFYDRRTNQNGQPKMVVWDGEQLVNVDEDTE